MSTSKETVAYVLGQLEPLDVRARAMFGEYGLYCDEKMVALICNDTVFVKPTAVSGDYLDASALAPPYPGAKDHLAIPGDRLEDTDWLHAFVQRTADVLPQPKKKPKKPTSR
ncbi:TfoX/Sxy family protein [Rhodococcus tukisamuensis]|uniref:Transcriptional regulator of competence genes, TfoX/Sxy family n=1 Tax=Rhodococcus tukisamuensis TaxID=168276 RepID=A0A1G7BH08_9NOCA|nr:TfoX/Sxy family protein [Rhodococcus tukisamuensis]SDE26157.1 Transcriptional regulator of competence genes, TfoX/Sxy family [Rhodococcus tukisamuensis]